MLFGEAIDYPEAERQLGMCVDAGVDFFDTVSATRSAAAAPTSSTCLSSHGLKPRAAPYCTSLSA